MVSMVGVGDNRSRSTNLEKAKMEIEQNSKQMLASNRSLNMELKKKLKSKVDRDRKGANLSGNLSGHRVALGHRLWVTHLLWNLPAIDAHYQHQHQQEHH